MDNESKDFGPDASALAMKWLDHLRAADPSLQGGMFSGDAAITTAIAFGILGGYLIKSGLDTLVIAGLDEKSAFSLMTRASGGGGAMVNTIGYSEGASDG